MRPPPGANDRQIRERRAAKLREATRQQRAAARVAALAAVREARLHGGDAREAAAAAVASAVGGRGGEQRRRRREEPGAFPSDDGGAPSWDPDEWADLERELVEEALAEEADEQQRAEAAALAALWETHQSAIDPVSAAASAPAAVAVAVAVPTAEEVAEWSSCPLCGVRGALAATAGGALACSAFAFAFLDESGSGGAPLPQCRFSVSRRRNGPGSGAPNPRELAEAIKEAERAHAATGCPVAAPGRRRTLDSDLSGSSLVVSCGACGFSAAAAP